MEHWGSDQQNPWFTMVEIGAEQQNLGYQVLSSQQWVF
jgi:hypothetical protein